MKQKKKNYGQMSTVFLTKLSRLFFFTGVLLPFIASHASNNEFILAKLY